MVVVLLQVLVRVIQFVDFYFAIKNKNHNFDMYTVFTVKKNHLRCI